MSQPETIFTDLTPLIGLEDTQGVVDFMGVQAIRSFLFTSGLQQNRSVKMKRREITRDEWPDFFESFTGEHQGWLVGVDRFDEFLDETMEMRHLDGALRGLEADREKIALAVDDRTSGHLETEAIHNPQRIVLEQSEDDVDTSLEIDGPQSCLILRFRSPMPSVAVEGAQYQGSGIGD